MTTIEPFLRALVECGGSDLHCKVGSRSGGSASSPDRPTLSMAMNPGQRAEFSYRVTAADTAAQLGSGDVAVLGTPRVLGLMERATVQAVARSLEPGDVRGGNRISARPRSGQARFAVRG